MSIKRVLAVLVAAQVAFSASARVKLVALPERGKTSISLEQPGATLVEEERLLTLQKGINKIDFSWRGVNIDPASIFIRIIDKPGEIAVASTSYPPNENALIWEITSAEAAETKARITYIMHGFSREIFYKAVANPDETSLSFRSYLRLKNYSGEDFKQAEVRYGFGTNITKDILHEESLELLSSKADTVPIKKVLTWDAAKSPWDPEYERNTVGIPLTYVLTNSTAFNLGRHTLQHGKARIFMRGKETGEGGESVTFTGEDWAALTPVGRELKFYIGQSRDVKVTQRKTRSDKQNIRRNKDGGEVVWDLEEHYKVEVENFKKTPVDIVLVEHIPGYWRMEESSHKFDKKDAFTIEYPLKLAAETTGEKKTTLSFKLTRINVQGNEPTSY